MPGQSFRGFAERVALVTGGARGIGRAVALQLALEGAYVIVQVAPGDAEGGSVARELLELGTLAQAVEADVSSDAGVGQLLTAVDEMFGRLDLLVCAVSLSRGLALEQLSTEVWDEVHHVSLRSAFLCARASVPLMRGRPSPAIVNVASEIGLSGGVGSVAEVAAQAGIIGLTKALARELAPRVRVNCVAVGGPLMPDEIGGRHTAGEREQAGGPIAGAAESVGRPPVADEVARVCLYLLSSDARSVSGETLRVGGLR